MMPVSIWTIGLLAAAVSIAPAVRAQHALDRDGVQRWFDAAWRLAQEFPELGDVSVCWRIEIVYVPSEEALRRLRDEVRGHPDHPQRWELESYERRLGGKPDVIRHCLWSNGPNRWRFNQEPGAGIYIDTAVTPSVSWKLTKQALLIIETAGDASPIPDGGDLQAHRRMFWPEWGQLVHGGLTFGTISGLRPHQVEVEGDRWSVTATSANDTEGEAPTAAYRFTGRWDSAEHRGFVEEWRVTANAYAPHTVGETRRFLDWRRVDELGQFVAHRIEWRRADGSPDRVIHFEGAVAHPAGAFEAAVSVPELDRPDPVRGPTTYTSIYDHRTGVATELGEGEPATHAIPTSRSVRQATAWRRWAGWMLLGVLVVALGGIWGRRRMQGA